MLRVLAVSLVLVATSGCLGHVEPIPTPSLPDVSVQRLEGVLTSVAAAGHEMVPDQAAGQAHREIYVAEGTRVVVLRLETQGGELHVRAGPRGCEDCPVETATVGGRLDATVDAPEAGAWLVELRAASPQAPEVAYTLESEHARSASAAGAVETYTGSVVAVHAGAARVSPDQLGEVLREVWVPENATLLRLDVEAAPDLDVVVGRWAPGRDRESEQSFPSVGGRVRIDIDAPEPGGWYVIFFHPTEGPGVQEASYTMRAMKTTEP